MVGLEFVYISNAISKPIDYESLGNFIREEFLKNKSECEEKNEKISKLSEELEQLKKISKEKEEEYIIRQKQVTTYLECKKSFFGRIRYFFKGNKKIKEFKEEAPSKVQTEQYEEKEELIYDNKQYYTIEDLIELTKVLDRVEIQIRNITSDITALEATIERLSKKIKNAKSYLEEIEDHKKSIFEFWKFVNDDNVLRFK